MSLTKASLKVTETNKQEIPQYKICLSVVRVASGQLINCSHFLTALLLLQATYLCQNVLQAHLQPRIQP